MICFDVEVGIFLMDFHVYDESGFTNPDRLVSLRELRKDILNIKIDIHF